MKAKRCCLADNPCCEYYKKDMCTAEIGSCPEQSITPKMKNPVPMPKVKPCKSESKNNLIEVIYCKDCKFYNPHYDVCSRIINYSIMKDEDFCSYAELKENSKMKKIYRADDGTEFDTEAECIAYESGSKPLMWDFDSEPTDDAGEAKYLYLQDENAAKMFIRLCKDEDDHVGIDGEADGFFCWDEISDAYNWIDSEELTHIWELMHKVCPEKFKEKKI